MFVLLVSTASAHQLSHSFIERSKELCSYLEDAAMDTGNRYVR